MNNPHVFSISDCLLSSGTYPFHEDSNTPDYIAERAVPPKVRINRSALPKDRSRESCLHLQGKIQCIKRKQRVSRFDEQIPPCLQVQQKAILYLECSSSPVWALWEYDELMTYPILNVVKVRRR
jgi:hypothetical protein